MSLDVYLYYPAGEYEHACPDCGHVHTGTTTEDRTVFSSNITHNLGEMADEAGIYYILWRPEEVGIKTAGEIIETLRSGIKRMVNDPSHFQSFSAANGWGTYVQFMPWLEEYLAACEKYPDALVRASR